METERRECPRMPVVLDAVLRCQASAVVCAIRDISLNGAFLEACPETLPYNGAVEVGIWVNVGGKIKDYNLPATIRRVTEEGAGVSFGDIGQEAYFSLVDLVYADRATADAQAMARQKRIP